MDAIESSANPGTGRRVIAGDSLEAIREANGLTKSRLAVQAQISLQYLCDLESGRRKGTNPAIAKALATALDCKITAITRRELEAA